jgi:TM2 domain-containing membrane protein YozV
MATKGPHTTERSEIEDLGRSALPKGELFWHYGAERLPAACQPGNIVCAAEMRRTVGSSDTPRRPNYGHSEWQRNQNENYNADARGPQGWPNQHPSDEYYHHERGSFGGGWQPSNTAGAGTWQARSNAGDGWRQQASGWDSPENNLGADNFWKQDPNDVNHGGQPYEAPRPEWDDSSYRSGSQNQGDTSRNGQPKKVPSFEEVSQRSAIIAGILGIFLGAFGVHNFYTGRYKIGLIQLGLTVLSSFNLSIIVGIWGVVEGILHLVGTNPWYQQDGWGRPLSR